MTYYQRQWIDRNIPLELFGGLAHDGTLCVSPNVIDTQFTSAKQGWFIEPDERWNKNILGLTRLIKNPSPEDKNVFMFVPVLQLLAARGKSGASPLVRGWLCTTAHEILAKIAASGIDMEKKRQALALAVALALEQDTVSIAQMQQLQYARDPLEGIVMLACMAAGVPLSLTGVPTSGDPPKLVNLPRLSPYPQPTGIPNSTGWLCFFATTLQCMAAVNASDQNIIAYDDMMRALRSGQNIITAQPNGGESVLKTFISRNGHRFVNGEVLQQIFRAIVYDAKVTNGQQDLVEFVDYGARNGLLPVTRVILRGESFCDTTMSTNPIDTLPLPTLPLRPSTGGNIHALLHDETFHSTELNQCLRCGRTHEQTAGWRVVTNNLEKGKALVVTVRWPQTLPKIQITADRVLSLTDQPGDNYVLRSVAMHQGVSAGGHYTAFVELAGGSWAQISDGTVYRERYPFALVQRMVAQGRPAAFFYERMYD